LDIDPFVGDICHRKPETATDSGNIFAADVVFQLQIAPGHLRKFVGCLLFLLDHWDISDGGFRREQAAAGEGAAEQEQQDEKTSGQWGSTPFW
jgi:hypothetical protein